MKKLFVKLVPIWIFTLCSVLNIFAQTEFSKNIVDTTKQWNVLFNYPLLQQTITYKIAGDTIYDNKEYKKILEKGVYEDSDIFNFYGKLIRQDSLKVYYRNIEYYPECTKEYLLYDFGLTIGDTFYILTSSYEEFINCGFDLSVVKDVRDTIINGVSLKLFDFNKEVPYGGEYICIEGIGGSQGLLGYVFVIDGCTTDLLCCSSNDNLFYSNWMYDYCYIWQGIEDVSQSRLLIYPTMVETGSLYIKSDTFPLQIQVIDIYGNVLLNQSLYNNFLDISQLKQGVYFIKERNTNIMQKIIKL